MPLTPPMKNVRIRSLWDALRSSLWFVPSLMTVTAIGLALVTIQADRAGLSLRSYWFLSYSGGAEGARSVLSTVAGSMITVAGIAFSGTMVALSFASSTLGPRLLGHFMRDRGNQVVLGTFVATFVYCLVVLRTVRESPEEFVPHIGVTVGLLLSIASLAVLIYFIHHVASSLQADHVIAIVSRELDRSIEDLYPEGMGEDAAAARLAAIDAEERAVRQQPGAPVSAPVSGYVRALDLDRLMELAVEHDLVVHVLSRPGRYVMDGIAVAEIRPAGRASEAVRAAVESVFIFGRTRTSQQDVEFAINQLVEVAVRALSTGINDPFTAIACIDRLSTGILHLMRREFPSPHRVDSEGRLRVVANRADFAGITDAAFHQIRQSGAAVPAVAIRLVDALRALLEEAKTDEHRRALQRHLTLVTAAGVREAAEAADQRDLLERAAP